MKALTKKPTFRAGAIILLTLLVYIPAMRAGFIWDDDLFLTENPLIKADDGLYRFWFTTEPPDYFPLVSTSLWLEWRLWGMNATGYHVVNIVLHAVSSVLIWLVLRGLKIPGAWLAALIFAIHPVNVESVAWITERKNTQPLVLYVLTILLYLKFESSVSRRWYFLALFSFVLALLSKTSVVMLPFVLLGCAWWQRGRITQMDLVRTIPFFVLSAALGLVTLWFQYNVAIGGEIVRTDGFFSRLTGAGWAVWFYLYKAMIPYNLSFIYPRWEIDATSILSYLPALILPGCVALFWRYRRGWGRPLLFGFGYYVVTLFPVLGFFNIYFMKYSLVADHWQYISIIGIIALAVGIASYASTRAATVARNLLAITAVALVGMLCILTWRQGTVYTDIETLWRDTISKNPKASIAHVNLGALLKQSRRPEEAISHYYEALRLNPDDEAAHNNLGLAMFDRGRLDEAIVHYCQALEIKPNYAQAHHNLGLAYLRLGKTDKAISHFSRALQSKPDYAEAYDQLGIALYEKGRVEEAIRHLSKALQIKPDYAGAHSNLAIVLAQKGKIETAIYHFSEALRIEPDFAYAHHNLGLLLYRQGRLEKAIGHFSRALTVKRDYVDAHHYLGLALARKGEIEGAIHHFSEALRIEPDRAELHYHFGLALTLQGSEKEAIKRFSRAVEIDPKFAEAQYNLGAALARQGRLQEAITHFSEALRIKPDFAEASHSLTRALKDLRKQEKVTEPYAGQ